MDLKKYEGDKAELYQAISAAVDYYTASLQVAGYKVIINNHNIGRVHNVEILKFRKVKRKWYWTRNHVDLYELVPVEHLTVMIPDEIETLLCRFEFLLQETNVSWLSKIKLVRTRL